MITNKWSSFPLISHSPPLSTAFARCALCPFCFNSTIVLWQDVFQRPFLTHCHCTSTTSQYVTRIRRREVNFNYFYVIQLLFWNMMHVNEPLYKIFARYNSAWCNYVDRVVVNAEVMLTSLANLRIGNCEKTILVKISMTVITKQNFYFIRW